MLIQTQEVFATKSNEKSDEHYDVAINHMAETKTILNDNNLEQR